MTGIIIFVIFCILLGKKYYLWTIKRLSYGIQSDQTVPYTHNHFNVNVLLRASQVIPLSLDFGQF